MTELITDIAGQVFISLGVLIMLIGTFGAIFRMPDFYTRIHAVGVSDSLGLSLLLLGAMLMYGFSLMAAKLAILAILLTIISPTSMHALAGAAYRYDEARARGAFSDKQDGEL